MHPTNSKPASDQCMPASEGHSQPLLHHTHCPTAQALEMAADDDNVSVIVFTGTGDRAFCAGGNLAPDESGQVCAATRLLWLVYFLLACHTAVLCDGGNTCLPSTRDALSISVNLMYNARRWSVGPTSTVLRQLCALSFKGQPHRRIFSTRRWCARRC